MNFIKKKLALAIGSSLIAMSVFSQRLQYRQRQKSRYY